MGIRQTAQPLGIALGALVILELSNEVPVGTDVRRADMHGGGSGQRDLNRRSAKEIPQQATEQELASPYRGSSVLWRIHAVAGLLMMPQTVTVTFILVWLMDHHGWSAAAAGGLVTLSQMLGAVGRIAVGRWSDRVGSRMRPVRVQSPSPPALTLFLLAFTDRIGSEWDVLMMVGIR